MILRTTTLFAILLSAPLAQAQDETPAVLVWTRSFDAFVDQTGAFIEQIGQSPAASSFAELAKSKLGVKGWSGLDRSRPAGAFLRFNPDPSGAVILPISQEKDFIDLLERLDIKSVRENDGVYRLAVPLPIPVYAKVVGNDAWITALNKDGFAAAVDSARLFTKSQAAISARIRIEGIPKDARQLAISHFEDNLQQALKANPAGTPAQKAFSEACNQTVARLFAQVLEEGKSLALDVSFDAAGKALSLGGSLQPKPGTPLAKSLADGGRRLSVFAEQEPGQDAIVARLNLELPDAVARSFARLVEESFLEGAGGFRDEKKKKQAQELLDALKPTLDAGELDALFRLNGPSSGGKFGAVVGIKLKSGDRLGGIFKTLAEEARKQMTEAEQAKIMLDAEIVGGTAIHRNTLANSAQKRDVFGDPTLSLAFRPDALLVAIGWESQAAIRRLAEPSKAAPAPLASIAIDAARLSPLLAPKATPNATAGPCQLTVTGGEQLSFNLTLRTSALRYLSSLRTGPER